MASQLERNRTAFLAALRGIGGSVEGRNYSALCQKLGLGTMRGNNFSLTVSRLLAEGEVLRAEEPREVGGCEETIVTLSLPECKVTTDQLAEPATVTEDRQDDTTPGSKKKKLRKKTSRRSGSRRN